jgi:hypothetical protein
LYARYSFRGRDRGFTRVGGSYGRSAGMRLHLFRGAGTGGQSSDGQAGGFRLEGSSTGFPGSTFTNSGNQIAGHITVEGTANGTGSGAFTPQGVVVGHYDGVVAIRFGLDGDCSGVCG